MLVYYLESPYGHLMKDIMGNPPGRTHVKGNLFSFTVPWEDIEKCCFQACKHAKEPHRSEIKKIGGTLGLPHSEDTLALLVNVFIVGGSKDLAMHLSGLTMRVHVVRQLIEILRASGYLGYEADGVNSRALVAQRLDERRVARVLVRDEHGLRRHDRGHLLEARGAHGRARLDEVDDAVGEAQAARRLDAPGEALLSLIHI